MNDSRIWLSTFLMVETKKDTKAVALVCAGKLIKNSLAEVSNRKQTMKQDFNQH